MDKLKPSNEINEKTKQSEERLLALMKATSDVIYRMSSDWKTMSELYGLGFLEDTEDPDPEWLDKYIHPEDQAFVLNVINESIRDRKIFELQHRVLRVDGSIGWTHLRAVPLFDEKGNIKEWIGAANDITERKREEEHERFVRDILNAIASMSSSKEILRRTCRALGEYLRVGNVHMADMDEETDTARAYQGFTDQTVPPLEGEWPNVSSFWHPEMTAAFRKGMTVVVRNAQHHPWTIAEKYAPTGVAAFVTVPFIQEGVWRHFISVISAEPRDWCEDEIRVAERVTKGVFPHLQRARAEEALRENEKQLAADLEAMTRIQKISTSFEQNGNLNSILNDVLEAAINICGAKKGTLQLINPGTENLEIVVQSGFERNYIDFFSSLSQETAAVCAEAFKTKERAIVEDVMKSPIFKGTPALEVQLNAGVRAVQSTPLLSRNGEVIGILSTHWDEPRRPDEHTLRYIDILAGQASDMIEKMKADEALRESEEKYRLLYNSIGQGFFVIDVLFDENDKPVDMYYLEANKAATDILGFNFTGKRLREINPDYEEFWYDIFGKVAKTGESVRLERYSMPDDKWFDFFVFKIEGSKGLRIGNIFFDITGRKRAEEAVRESEEKYRMLFDTMDEGFCIIEKVRTTAGQPSDFRYLTANPAFEQHSGLVNVIGKTILELVPGADTEIMDIYDNVALSGQPRNFESYIRARDHWLEAKIYPTKIPGQIAVLFSNITERKKAEEILTFQAHMLASLQEAICAVDENFNITFWNKMAEKIFGWTAQEAIGSPSKEIFEMISPSDREETIDNILMNNGYTGEAIYRKKNGKEVHTSVICSVMRDAQGNYKGNVSSFRDITERKQMEEVLRESETKFRQMAETVNSAFWISEFDSKGGLRYIYMSPIFESIFGIPVERIYADPQAWMKFIHPEDSERFFSAQKRRVAGEYAEAPDIRIIKPDGTIRWIKTNLFPVKDTDGKIIRYVGIADDITERREVEEALRESERLLRIADKNKNEFISVLSHELRNPLAAISAGVQILDVTHDTNQAIKVKEIINRQTNQLCRLVDDLLELTRITQNKIKLRKEEINLNEIVKSGVEDIRLEYEKKGIKLGTKIQTKPIRLNADAVRVTQAMSNILFNALKFTKANGTVWLTLKQEKDYAVISIKDNGIGMTPELLSHLFTPFTQADKSLDRNGSGLGLGLSIVKGIIDLHEGTVSAFSDGLGKGSTFTIRMPISRGDSLTTEKQVLSNNGGKGLKLLVIEDNRDFADLLRTMLSTIGYTVDIAYDGIEGLRLAKQIKPDVIFCDIGLPGMNGYDVAERIRNNIELKDIHLIALTGYASAGDVELSLKAGFKSHLAKPIDFATLENVLNEVADNNKEVK